MLCYSFYGELLSEKEEASLGSEAFDNIYNLFSLLLCLLLKRQIKKGMYKDYNDIKYEANIIRGKLNINESINNNSIIKKKFICEHDQYDVNCLLNQVIKTTIFYLLKSNQISQSTKDELRKIYIYFTNVDILEIRSINWDSIRFSRNNMVYKFVIDLCKLILKDLIVSDEKGNNKFKEFLDDSKISTIYENFIKAYYRKHYPKLNARSKKLYLTDKPTSSNIPIMKTDITLEYNNKMLIIDAKFYNKILNKNYYINSNFKTISNSNLYQIITYVDNQDPYKENKVYGLLLYAQTLNDPPLSLIERLNYHKIMIQTLNLNASWNNIKENLNNIAESFIKDNF